MDVDPLSTDHEAGSFFCNFWKEDNASGQLGGPKPWRRGDQTGDDLMQASAGPERHCGLIRKLAFMKRSRLEARRHNDEHDTGAGLGLTHTPAILLSLCHDGTYCQIEPWSPCLVGPVDMPGPFGVKGGFNNENNETICPWESCKSVSWIHEALGSTAG